MNLNSAKRHVDQRQRLRWPASKPTVTTGTLGRDESVDPSCVGPGLRPAATSHGLCALQLFDSPMLILARVAARDRIFADYNLILDKRQVLYRS